MIDGPPFFLKKDAALELWILKDWSSFFLGLKWNSWLSEKVLGKLGLEPYKNMVHFALLFPCKLREWWK